MKNKYVAEALPQFFSFLSKTGKKNMTELLIDRGYRLLYLAVFPLDSARIIILFRTGCTSTWVTIATRARGCTSLTVNFLTNTLHCAFQVGYRGTYPVHIVG